MNETQEGTSILEGIFGTLMCSAFGALFVVYVFTDTRDIDALILATRQSFLGW